jgi:hypothetical protein
MYPRSTPLSLAVVAVLMAFTATLTSSLAARAQEEPEGTGSPAVDSGPTSAQTPADTPPDTSDPPLPDLDQVLDHLDELYQAESSYARVTMSVVTSNFSRTLEIEGWSQGDDLSLMIIRAPAREAGTATLRTEEGLWNYAPRADRLMRIPSSLLSESWMGSHFTNDDLMRESRYDDDYDTTLSWVMEAGERLLKVSMVPHADTAIVYSRIDFLLRPPDWTPVRAEFFDDDERVRSMAYSNVRDVSGRPVPMTLVVVPDDAPTESTTVTYDHLELDVAVDADIFTARGLRRAAQRN